MDISKATTTEGRNADLLVKIYNPDGNLIASILPSDSSYHYAELMGRNDVTLNFETPTYVDIPVGSYIIWRGTKFTLRNVDELTMQHRRDFEYSVTFDSLIADLSTYLFVNPDDGRFTFSLTGKPRDHVKLLTRVLTARTGAEWNVGALVANAEGDSEATEKTVSYDANTCLEALNAMADAWETEWRVYGTTIDLCKVEFFTDTPLTISYGKGNGLRAGVRRTVDDSSATIGRVYVQGTDRNIDSSKYRDPVTGAPCSTLHLPAGVSYEFEGKTFKTSEDGRSVYWDDSSRPANEGALDLTDIYPTITHTISKVVCEDKDKCFWNIYPDTASLGSINYEECRLSNEALTVVFQTGMLAGKEFNANWKQDGKHFEIIPQEIDGLTMPSDVYIPKVGDTFKVFNMMLPTQYINDNENKTGAEWNLLYEAVKYLNDNIKKKFSISGEFDPIWTKSHWGEVGDRFVIGAYFNFMDETWMPEGTKIRITNIKTFLHKPYCPEVDLSNGSGHASLGTTLRKISAETKTMPQLIERSSNLSKRRYKDALDTIEALRAYLLGEYSDVINPVAVKTMQLLIGDERLQFDFYALDSETKIDAPVKYNTTTGDIECGACRVIHHSIGGDSNKINAISDSHTYGVFNVAETTIDTPDKDDSQYYLYITIYKSSAQSGKWQILEVGTEGASLAFYDSDNQAYNLLAGIFNAKYDGERSFAPLYGFTEILPGRITTDRIVSGDGVTYFDLANSVIGGNIKFRSSSGTERNVSEIEADLAQAESDLNDAITKGDSETLATAQEDISVFGQTIISGGHIKTELIDANALIIKRLLAGDSDGQRVDINPDNKAVDIFDKNGELVSTFEGNSYDEESLFGDSSGDVTGLVSAGSITQLDGKGGSNRTTSSVFSKVISDVFHTDGAVEVVFGGGVLTLEAYAEALIVTKTAVEQLSTSAYIYGGLHLLTFSDEACTAQIEDKCLEWGASASNISETVGMTDRKTIAMTGRSLMGSSGYHRLELTFSLSARQSGSYAKGSWSGISGVSYKGSFYISRYFANGLCLGRRADDYVAIMADSDSQEGMTLIANTLGEGLCVSQSGIETRTGGGTWLNMPTLLAFFNVTTSSSGATINVIKCSGTESLGAIRTVTGGVLVTFPSLWVTAFGLTNDNVSKRLLINVVPYTKGTAMTSVVLSSLTKSSLQLAFYNGTTRIDGGLAYVSIFKI